MFYVQCEQNKMELEDNMSPTEHDDVLNTDITQAEVESIISKLKNKKASGIDSIPNEVLKYSNLY